MKCPKCRQYRAIITKFRVEGGRVYKCLACGKVFVRDGRGGTLYGGCRKPATISDIAKKDERSDKADKGAGGADGGLSE